MSYTPTSWNTGDTITASAMNKIENGIANAGGALICNVVYEAGLGYKLDKTAQEIYDAMSLICLDVYETEIIAVYGSDKLFGSPEIRVSYDKEKGPYECYMEC